VGPTLLPWCCARRSRAGGRRTSTPCGGSPSGHVRPSRDPICPPSFLPFPSGFPSLLGSLLFPSLLDSLLGSHWDGVGGDGRHPFGSGSGRPVPRWVPFLLPFPFPSHPIPMPLLKGMPFPVRNSPVQNQAQRGTRPNRGSQQVKTEEPTKTNRTQKPLSSRDESRHTSQEDGQLAEDTRRPTPRQSRLSAVFKALATVPGISFCIPNRHRPSAFDQRACTSNDVPLVWIATIEKKNPRNDEAHESALEREPNCQTQKDSDQVILTVLSLSVGTTGTTRHPTWREGGQDWREWTTTRDVHHS